MKIQVVYIVETNAIITASLYLDANDEIVDWFALVGEFDTIKIEFLSFTPNDELCDDQTMYYSITQIRFRYE